MNLSDETSTWILLQPSDVVKNRVRENFLAESEQNGEYKHDAMWLHSLLHSSAVNTFGEYIEDIQSDVTEMVRSRASTHY